MERWQSGLMRRLLKSRHAGESGVGGSNPSPLRQHSVAWRLTALGRQQVWLSLRNSRERTLPKSALRWRVVGEQDAKSRLLRSPCRALEPQIRIDPDLLDPAHWLVNVEPAHLRILDLEGV